MNAIAAALAAAAAAIAGALALRRRAPASTETANIGGLWGLLNEGSQSSQFLPSPDPVPAPDAGGFVDALLSIAQPRGIRNRNPGNVKISGSQWLGKVPVAQNTDGTFEQFTDAKFGIRVIAYLLLKYQRDKGKRTVRALISEPGGWAPTNADANPAGYAAYVARAMGIPETAYVDLFARDELLSAMVTAIIQFENAGAMPYGSALVAEGVRLGREAFK